MFQKLYDDICLKIKHSEMTDKIVEKFGITPDRDGVLSLIAPMEEEGDEIVRDLLDIFFDALNNGDKAAIEIADVMAERGAQFICAHIRNQVFEGDTIQVVLSGSMHCKLPSDIYVNKLIKMTEEISGKKLEFIKLQVAPVMGCINWMLED